jgi:hypothetical protein
VVVDGLYVFYSVIGETEAAKVALLVGLVNSSEGRREWDTVIGCVNVENVNL